jgi:TolA-binding protein
LKRGSAALKVDSDKLEDLFKVVTPAGDVEVNGTVFYVSVSAAAQLTVAVVESAVTIRDSANPRNVIPVRAGQEIEVDWSAIKVSPIERELEKRIPLLLGLTPQADTHTGENENDTDKGGSRVKKKRMNRADAEELFAQATLARKSGQVEEAANLYRSVIQSNPQTEIRAEAAFHLGQLYFATSNFAAAEKSLIANRGALERSSFQDKYLFYLAKTQCRLGKIEQAKQVIEKFQTRFPNHALSSSVRTLEVNCGK